MKRVIWFLFGMWFTAFSLVIGGALLWGLIAFCRWLSSLGYSDPAVLAAAWTAVVIFLGGLIGALRPD